MKKMKKRVFIDCKIVLIPFWVMVLVVGFLLAGCSTKESNQTQSSPEEKIQVADAQVLPGEFKVLHIMSYHSSWIWNQDQLNGFKAKHSAGRVITQEEKKALEELFTGLRNLALDSVAATKTKQPKQN